MFKFWLFTIKAVWGFDQVQQITIFHKKSKLIMHFWDTFKQIFDLGESVIIKAFLSAIEIKVENRRNW